MNPEEAIKRDVLIGVALIILRKRQLMTQRDAAEQLGVSRATWCTYEYGQATLGMNMLYRIATELHITPIQFLKLVGKLEAVMKRMGLVIIEAGDEQLLDHHVVLITHKRVLQLYKGEQS